METMQLYVKMTTNCPDGLCLSTFELLGPTWTGDVLRMLFGPVDEQRRRLRVLGWTDLFSGQPCAVSVARVREISGLDHPTGYLVWGGNSGVRVLDPTAEQDSHLPPGWGMPVIWVDDPADLPVRVRKVVMKGARTE